MKGAGVWVYLVGILMFVWGFSQLGYAFMGFLLPITIPFTDLLIAAVALESGAVLLHRDRHFDYIASQSALKVESLVPA